MGGLEGGEAVFLLVVVETEADDDRWASLSRETIASDGSASAGDVC
jgi:hypothetical protein